MSGFASAALSALLGLALAGPSASLACEPSAPRCPGMSPELAALCHHAGATVPECCEEERPAPQRRAPDAQPAPELASAPATEIVVGGAAEALTAGDWATLPASRAAALHELGLFTLYAVFRI